MKMMNHTDTTVDLYTIYYIYTYYIYTHRLVTIYMCF